MIPSAGEFVETRPSFVSKSVLIIGGGVIGLCSAYYCAVRGHQVSVVERNGLDRDGCSFGNAGMVVPSHVVPLAAPGMVALGLRWMWNPESPFWIKPRFAGDLFVWAWRFWQAANPEHVRRSAPLLRDLHLASRARFQELAHELSADFGLVTRGLLMLCKTELCLEEEAKVAEMARALGIPADVLNPAETATLDPNVQMAVAGGIYFPKDCHFSPERFMAALQGALVRMGTNFMWQTEVTGFVRKGARLCAVRTNRGDIQVDEVVLAGGVWSSVIARELGLTLLMQAGKGYSLTLPAPRQLPTICSILVEARVAVTPIGETLRVGGTMEIAGFSRAANPRRVRGIAKAVPRYYPQFRVEDFAGLRPWSGLRPCSPDGLPYLGRSRRWQNLLVATGHAMLGMSLGPITGEIVSRIVSEEAPEHDLALLSPDRYSVR